MTSTTPDGSHLTDAPRTMPDRTGTRDRPLAGLLRRWPTLAGIALAGLTAFDLSSGAELAPILVASALIYLAAAALKKRAAAWPVFFGAFVVIAAANVMTDDVDATWFLLGLAGLFLAYGLIRGAARPADGLPLQTIAMVAFGTAAAVTLIVDESVGAYLVAAGLLGHAAWDVYHHRVNRVVVRSMAEFCFVLDTLLAIAVVIVATWG